MDDVLSSFTGQRVGFPLTYLGLPLVLGRLWLVHVQQVQDKALAKLSGWQCNLLNPGGRRVLVRSVLSSLPVYLLTVIKPPKQFFKLSIRCADSSYGPETSGCMGVNVK
jgi:hypothetical protein